MDPVGKKLATVRGMTPEAIKTLLEREGLDIRQLNINNRDALDTARQSIQHTRDMIDLREEGEAQAQAAVAQFLDEAQMYIGDTLALQQKEEELALKLAAISQNNSAISNSYLEQIGRLAAETVKNVGVSQEALDAARAEYDSRMGQHDETIAQLEQNLADAEKQFAEDSQKLTDALASANESMERLDHALYDPEGVLQTTTRNVSQELATLDDKLANTTQDLEARIVQSSNGKNSVTVTYGLNPNREGDATGDVWWRVDDKGNVIGFWTWDEHSRTWVPQTIEHQVISSVDVNKLTVASTATMNEAVINKVWADGIAAKSITAARISISGDGNLLPEIQSFVGGTILSNNDKESPYRDFGFNSEDPSMWIKGRKDVYIYHPIQLVAGAEYVFEFDVMSTVAGTRLYWRMLSGSIDTPNTPPSTITVTVRGTNSINLVTNYLVSGAMRWEHVEVVFSSPVSATAWLRLLANHQNGTANKEGYQWFRNVRLYKRTGATLIEDGAITTDKVAAGAITAKQIEAGTITGKEIAADTISARNLTITPGNLFPDPYFKDPTWDSGNVSRITGGGLSITASGVNAGRYFQPEGKPADSAIQMEPGATYLITVDVKFDGTDGVTFFNVNMRYTRNDGGKVIRGVSRLHRNDATSYKWGTLTGTLVAPDNMGTAPCTLGFSVDRSHPDGSVSINNVRLVRAADASLIVKGGIIADHISSGAITAKKLNIKSGEMDGAWIKDATINNAKILSGLDATKITSGTIDARRVSIENMDASSITTGALRADRIEANSFAQLGQSLIPNIPGTTTPQIHTGNNIIPVESTHAWQAESPVKDTIIWRGDRSDISVADPIPIKVDSNTKYYYHFWARGPVGSRFGIRMQDMDTNSYAMDNSRVEWVKGKTSGNYWYVGGTHEITKDGWEEFEGYFYFLPDTKWVQLHMIQWNLNVAGVNPASQCITGLDIRAHLVDQAEINKLQSDYNLYTDAVNQAQTNAIAALADASASMQATQANQKLINEAQASLNRSIQEQLWSHQDMLEQLEIRAAKTYGTHGTGIAKDDPNIQVDNNERSVAPDGSEEWNSLKTPYFDLYWHYYPAVDTRMYYKGTWSGTIDIRTKFRANSLTTSPSMDEWVHYLAPGGSRYLKFSSGVDVAIRREYVSVVITPDSLNREVTVHLWPASGRWSSSTDPNHLVRAQDAKWIRFKNTVTCSEDVYVREELPGGSFATTIIPVGDPIPAQKLWAEDQTGEQRPYYFKEFRDNSSITYV